MPELTIKYTDKKTLDVLRELAKSLNFSIKLKKDKEVKTASIIPADPSIEISDIKEIFSKYNLNASKLRKDAWSRNGNL